MTRVCVWAGTAALALVPFVLQAETTCYGEGAYQVCSTVTQRADGSISVDTYDTEGNTYSLDSETHVSPNGDVRVHSYDSEGNSYEVRSWNDSLGSHSVDSEGNRCTITKYGTTIGC